MFKFLKDKLKKAISAFSKKAEEEAEEEVIEVEVKEEKKEVKKPKKVEKPKPKVEKPKEIPEKKEIKKEVEEPIKEIPEEVKPIVEEVEEKPEVEKEIKEEKPEVVEEEIPAKIEKVIEKKKEEKKGFFTKLFKREAKPEEIEKEVIPEEVKKEVEELIEEKPEEVKPIVEEVEEKPEAKEEVKEEKVKEVKEEVEEEKVEEPKGFFQKIKQKIITKKISGKQFQDMFWELEVAMLENNVAVEVIEKIKQDLEKELVDTPIQRGKVEAKIIASLKKSIEDLFIEPSDDFITTIKSKKPYVICFVGINGSGKTTSMAKVAHMLQKKKLSVVLAASDTFRAAAIDQLQIHADKLGVKLIKHEYGSDAAAVAFDAIKHAESKGIDVVLIDTAGRLHSNVNLMDEMKKIMRVANPDMKIFVGESITGNDCVEQAKKFDEAISLDGIILSKADVDEKGGAAISVSFVTGKPIYFLGMGQEYDDLEVFNSQKIVSSLGL